MKTGKLKKNYFILILLENFGFNLTALRKGALLKSRSIRLVKISCLLLFYFVFFSCIHTVQTISDNTNTIQPIKGTSIFLTGVNLFKKGNFVAAKKYFETLNYGDKYFLLALLEIQKINYLTKRWDQFFGVAIYYREIFLFSNKTAKENFQQEMLVLEILALIRHCRFYESKQIIEWTLNLTEELNKDASKIKKAAYFVNLKKWIGDQKKKEKETDWKEQIYYWPVHSNQLKLLDNPKNLRVKVNNQC